MFSALFFFSMAEDVQSLKKTFETQIDKRQKWNILWKAYVYKAFF